MEEQLIKEIDELKRRVQELEFYVEEKKRQQLTFPLDETSKTILDTL